MRRSFRKLPQAVDQTMHVYCPSYRNRSIRWARNILHRKIAVKSETPATEDLPQSSLPVLARRRKQAALAATAHCSRSDDLQTTEISLCEWPDRVREDA